MLFTVGWADNNSSRITIQMFAGFGKANACQHLIYKKAALPVAFLDVDKGAIICICLRDFKGFRNTATKKIESIAQHITLQRLAEKHQLSEQDIMTLIRN
ncbi:hypothetical protein [Paraglaciecola sp. MB-3u-78]|uniref:hypothetical protein n=1 Tax=Paraglaciecola sp. MB-3u-78 TaxID=2058332 RepID=UPI001E6164C4|nr:hypothetical protein [Paraglaciecola sp. MB-3u-78]